MAGNRNIGLKLAGGALLAFLLLRGKASGIQVATQHGAINNPGNIKREPKQYPGEIASPSLTFKSFSSLAYGYAAMITKLHSYFASGYTTLREIINHWAPAEDSNDPDSYIQYIVDRMGTPIDPDETFPIEDDGQILTVISLMSDFEQGAGFGEDEYAWNSAIEAFNYV